MFCCRGCEGAYDLVNGLGLERFYAMTNESKLQPANQPHNDYSVYDAEEFQADFMRTIEGSARREANLLIEGITCYACVWLIRQAVEKHFAGLSETNTADSPPTVTINQATGAAILNWNHQELKLSSVVQFIESLGYRVMPHRGASLRTDHSALIRVGVGLFVMLNVMSFALAEYLAGADGLDPALETFLRWISFALTAISLAWPGREFFTNTVRSVKTRSPNIDAPILVGLLAASAWSVVNTITESGAVYYDSICAIVALVITGRFVQQNVLRRNQTRMAALTNPKDGWVLVKRPDPADGNKESWIPVRSRDVKKGEMLRLLPGDMMPMKVTCVSSCAEISFEQLRGEPHWSAIAKGDEIPAGALNGATPIDVIANQNGAESYTESLSKAIERAINEKGQYQRWSDRAAWILFIVVFIAAAAVFLVVGSENPEEGLRRGVALLLVACPCTFAIGVPLTFGTAMTKALHDGILFKSQRSLEKLAGIRHFIFDKTGTLTEGLITVTGWTWSDDVSEQTKQLILSRLTIIDQNSSHHTAKAIASAARQTTQELPPQPNKVRESHGLGMTIEFNTDRLLIGNSELLQQEKITLSTCGTGKQQTFIAWNKQVVAAVELDDTTKSEAADLLDELRSMDCKTEILSGDTQNRTNRLAEELAIETTNAHGQATPGSKMLYVRSKSANKPVAMVGNGLNDAGAMAEAEVSIAVASSSSSAVTSADVCLLNRDVSLVGRALLYSIKARQRMMAVFGFALMYNAIGLTLAALGYVTPVVAAILMPISSLTVTRVATVWSVDDGKSIKLRRA